MRLDFSSLAPGRALLASFCAVAALCACDSPPPELDGGTPMDAFRPDGTARPDGARDCMSDEECDDRLPCTRDSCDRVLRFCRNTPDHPMCDDGLFCNGVEICDTRRGCMPAGGVETCNDDQVCTIDRCNEADKTCEHMRRDLDEDGDVDFFCRGGTDCDDRDPARSSRLPEICGDMIDNDCDDRVDEDSCGRPPHDVCSDALDISAGGVFLLNTDGATPDYQLGCLGTTMRADVVATFTLTEPRDVQIEAEGDLFTTALSLRDASACEAVGTEIECRTGFPGRIRRRAMPAGTYSLIVSGFGSGEIVVDARFGPATEPPANETCAAPIDVSAGGTFMASMVDVADDLMTSCGFSGSPDLTYVFTTTEERDVRVSATARTGESVAWEIRPTCESSVGRLRCAYGGPASGRVHRLPAGTYYLIVEGPTFAEVDMTLDVAFLAPTAPARGDLCSDPIPLPLGTSVVGTLAIMQDDLDTTCGFRYRDAVYAVTLTESSDLTIAINGSGSFMNASVRATCTDSAGQLRCSSGSPLRQRLRGLAAGTYYIIVESSRGSSYTIQADASPPVIPTPVLGNDTCASAIVVPTAGGLFSGTTVGMTNDYQTAACGAMAMSPDVAFSLTLTERRRVTASTDGTAFDTVLHMHRMTCTSGAEMACDDDSGEGSASFLERTLDAGTYLFVVDGWGAGSSGTYLFEIQTYAP